MADVGEEDGFCAVDLGQSLGAPALLFKGPRIGDAGDNLPGD